MSKPTVAERKNWWLMVYAHTSFEKSLDTCLLLLRHVTSTRDDLYLPLAVAIYAFYGRPFKMQRGIGKLPANYIPKERNGIHDILIMFRDQLLVHTDAIDVRQAGRPLHDVVYHQLGQRNWFSTSDPRPEVNFYRKVARYLQELLEKVKADIDKIHERYGYMVPSIDGHHQLSITEGELFTAHNPPANTLKF